MPEDLRRDLVQLRARVLGLRRMWHMSLLLAVGLLALMIVLSPPDFGADPGETVIRAVAWPVPSILLIIGYSRRRFRQRLKISVENRPDADLVSAQAAAALQRSLRFVSEEALFALRSIDLTDAVVQWSLGIQGDKAQREAARQAGIDLSLPSKLLGDSADGSGSMESQVVNLLVWLRGAESSIQARFASPT